MLDPEINSQLYIHILWSVFPCHQCTSSKFYYCQTWMAGTSLFWQAVKHPPATPVLITPVLLQLGHDGATPESCWLVDELSVAVPTRGVKYIFRCKCWLAKDRGDGLTARVLSILDADTANITQTVQQMELCGGEILSAISTSYTATPKAVLSSKYLDICFWGHSVIH